jgi:hypothetical protein
VKKAAPLDPPPAKIDNSPDGLAQDGGQRNDRVSSLSTRLEHDANVAIAWPVAAVVNLDLVFVEELHIKRSPEGYTQDDAVTVDVVKGVVGTGSDPDDKKLLVRIPLKARVSKKNVPANSEPAIAIDCCFMLVYSLPSFDGLTEDQFVAFAKTSGLFNVWPYWRQVVHNASLQLGLPAVVLPTHRVG